jgi:predicted ester cyclase
VSVDQLIADGDFVVVRWTATGTNSGEGNGLPATGRRIRSTGMTIYRFVDGRIAEEWSAFDRLGAYRQLGLLPVTISK